MGLLHVFIALTVFIVVESRYVSEKQLNLIERVLDLLEERGNCAANIKVLGEGIQNLDVTGDSAAILANDQYVDITLQNPSGAVQIKFSGKYAIGFKLKVNGSVKDEAQLAIAENPSSEELTLNYSGPATTSFQVTIDHGNGREAGIKNMVVKC